MRLERPHPQGSEAKPTNSLIVDPHHVNVNVLVLVNEPEKVGFLFRVRLRSMKWTLLFIGFANELQGAKVTV